MGLWFCRLGVQVLLLVRDPRGTMQSRHHREWCPGSPDCSDPAWLCRDLVSDFHTAKKFSKKFPNSFRFVHFFFISHFALPLSEYGLLFDFFLDLSTSQIFSPIISFSLYSVHRFLFLNHVTEVKIKARNLFLHLFDIILIFKSLNLQQTSGRVSPLTLLSLSSYEL